MDTDFYKKHSDAYPQGTLKVTSELPLGFIYAQVQSALDCNSIGYWCDHVHIEMDPKRFSVFNKDYVYLASDCKIPGKTDAKRYRLDYFRAARLAVEQYPHVLDGDRMDSVTGDVFIQLAAFGEVLFG